MQFETSKFSVLTEVLTDPSLETLPTQMCPYTSKEAVVLVKSSEGFKKHPLQPSMPQLGPLLSKQVTEELKFLQVVKRQQDCNTHFYVW